MGRFRLRTLHTALFCAAALVLASCGKEPSSSSESGSKKAVEEKVPPYSYPAPVKGHVKEVNIGEFDLVDGIAYPSSSGGTVVFVVSKPIASPLLADSACPFIQAKALSVLRDASFSEVALDAGGRSKYFAAGTPFHGSLTDTTPGGRQWSSTLKPDAGRAAGSVTHRQYGRFEFDLPLSNPKVDEISYGDREQKRRLAATTPKPSEQLVKATYEKLRDAALKKDQKALLAAMGFDAKQTRAVRGLDGIGADFAAFYDRFLAPGTPGDPWSRPGSGQIRGEGLKASAGKKYWNDYYFELCGDQLVLTGITEQTQ
jgi:hypothetical protein